MLREMTSLVKFEQHMVPLMPYNLNSCKPYPYKSCTGGPTVLQIGWLDSEIDKYQER